jgi:chitinase
VLAATVSVGLACSSPDSNGSESGGAGGTEGGAETGGGDSGANEPPVIAPLSDLIAYVDAEVTLEIEASDPDGDTLTFAFSSTITDSTAPVLQQAGNKAVFRWTPTTSDIGTPSFDFVVSDGYDTATETITIEVRPADTSAPVIVQPSSTSMTLDVTQQPCLELDVLVEDPDSPAVTISQEDPVIEGAMLDQTGGLSAWWSWCPSADQINASSQYVLKLAADDGENPPTTKDILIDLIK